MYRSSSFRSTSRTNVQWFQHENGFEWQAQYIFNVCMNQPCTRSAKTLKKCSKTRGYNKFIVRKNGHENAPLQVDGANNKHQRTTVKNMFHINGFYKRWFIPGLLYLSMIYWKKNGIYSWMAKNLWVFETPFWFEAWLGPGDHHFGISKERSTFGASRPLS